MNEVSGSNASKMINMGDFILVWLDSTIDTSTEYFVHRRNQLRTLINAMHTFIDKNEFLEYIRTIHDERILLIVSGTLGQIIIPLIHDLRQLFRIYIYCADKSKHRLWSGSFNKVRDVFTDDDSLMACLEKDVKIHSNISLPIGIMDSKEYSLQDIEDNQVDFLWCQLLFEVIWRLPQTPMSKAELIEACRYNYSEDLAALNNIEEFYETYSSNMAISWYTKDSFLFRIFNKAFRTRNIDIMFSYRYFLTDLLKELSKLHKEQFSDKTGTLTVYRGQRMHVNELKRIENSIGHLISINTFFSTTKYSYIAADFAGNGEDRHDDLESVIFEISIDLSIQKYPFANISKCSVMDHEDEILFSVGCIFRIETVELYTDTIWCIQLKHSNDVKIEVENLLTHFKEQIGPQPSILELGVLLSNGGDLKLAKRFYKRLLSELPTNHYDLGVLYNNLGEIYRKENNFNIAMKYYRQALDEMTDSLGFNHRWCAVVHSNIATTLLSCSKLDAALVHFQCSLHIIQHYGNTEEVLYSTIYHGMGNVFLRKSNKTKALKLFEKALEIELKVLPTNHPSFVNSYACIGFIFMDMQNSVEALKYFKKAIDIHEFTLPSSHYDLATLYTVTGDMYLRQNNISEATACFMKVDRILDQSTLSADHPLREEIYRMATKILKTRESRQFRIAAHYKIIDVLKARIPLDQYQIIKWTTGLGEVFLEQRDNAAALDCYQIALDSIQKLPTTEKNRNLHLQIISNLLNIDHYEIFLSNAFRLLEESDPHSLFAGRIHNALGVCYLRLDNPQLSVEHFLLALNIFEKNPYRIQMNDIAIVHQNIGSIQTTLGNYDEAEQHLRRSLDILGDEGGELRPENLWSFALLYKAKNDFLSARKYFQDAVDNAKRIYPCDDPVIIKYTCSLQNIDLLISGYALENLTTEVSGDTVGVETNN